MLTDRERRLLALANDDPAEVYVIDARSFGCDRCGSRLPNTYKGNLSDYRTTPDDGIYCQLCWAETQGGTTT